MKKYIILAVLSILIIAFAFSAYNKNSKSSNNFVPSDFNVELKEGNIFPDFLLESLDGKKEISSKVFDKNKKTLIVLAAEWCPDCQLELPELEKFYEKNKSKYNIAVIFIKNNSSEEKVKDYISKNNFTFPVYYDYSGVIVEGTKINSIPTNIFMDENKKIIKVLAETIEDENYFSETLK